MIWLKKTLCLVAALTLTSGFSFSFDGFAHPVLAQNGGMTLARQTREVPTVEINRLPPEVRATVRLIQKGGPFPYRKDGTIFGNREKRLPAASRNYYREYTVSTPGASNRGARRLVVGGANEIYYYTGDHYGSFVRVRF